MATDTSSKSELTIDQLRDRLKGAEPPKKKARPSIASHIRALLPEVRTKRAAGWTWEQIAAALYDDEAKASAIRTAYNRLLRGKAKGKTKSLTAPKSSNGDGGAGGDAPPSTPRPELSSHIQKPPSAAPSSAQMADKPATARPSMPNLFGQLSDRGFGTNPHF